MNYKKLLVIGLVVVIAIGGIYLALHKPQSTTTSSASTTASSEGSILGKPAPDFSVQTIEGQQFSLAAHKGKPVIIFAMFGGCGECIPVGKTLNQVQKDYVAKGVGVIAVDILKGEPTSVLEQYRNDTQASFQFISYNASVVNAYKLTAPEITYVIDKNGNIANINQNALSYEQYKQQVERAL
jgi:cytochrome c biogenesis protein CcmG/thiol:disulfide interchange protein DsbE